MEAARSLGKIRPVSMEAGQALEAALKESSMRVRMQARTSLMGYKIGGYHVEAENGKQLPAKRRLDQAPVLLPELPLQL